MYIHCNTRPIRHAVSWKIRVIDHIRHEVSDIDLHRPSPRSKREQWKEISDGRDISTLLELDQWLELYSMIFLLLEWIVSVQLEWSIVVPVVLVRVQLIFR